MLAAVLQPIARRVQTKQLVSLCRSSLSTMETNKYKATIVNISPVLRLHKFKDEENAPVTLLMPWATASERALDRFRMLYAERGFNVLTAYAKPINFIWPRSSQPVAAEIVEFLRTKTGKAPIVVHAFSIGAFMYANVLTYISEHPDEFSALEPRIRGQVFDSIVIGTLKELRVGMGEMLTRRWILQQLIATGTSVYFYLTYGNTVAIYDQLIDMFWKNPFKTSVLCYYSLIDPMCKRDSIERFIANWKEQTSQPAHYLSTPDAKHAEIFRAIPDKYKDTLFKYLDTLKLEQQSSPTHSKL
ncbi:uncharacterized protein LOC119737747 isoform X2 [Patiria miniata]|uniref:Transmembrane protein 53 n=1 Tax=Patiria miniata TaxID=46514 RepID=A0A914AYB6_PATMI|nr:uncharacterized protein LOC119737747 isoform X2 [Patiria miniata]